MKEAISKAILRITGWKLDPVDDVDLPECIVCVTPHTSNQDFIVGKLLYTSIGYSAGFLIKEEWLFFPFNLLFNWLGGVPMGRGKRTSVTDQVVERFKTSGWSQLTVTPEGTRKQAKEWKKGFYFIALEASVPIVVAYFGYGKKEVGTKGVFYPTDDMNKDIHTIREMYRGVTAYHPGNFVQVQEFYDEKMGVLLWENKGFPQEKQKFCYKETTVSSP